MEAVIQVHRDGEGRLVGTLECSASGRQSFTGLMELVGLLEQGLEAGKDPTPFSEQDPARQ